ncbi:2-aminobenzoate-CoA ligase [Mangrovactinospora gilvigrisea]|uniref:2-aminobenzoate-CoA ligase n=1 Tax=Mangrovactinospora gilvigrisea TaxID=1428644 RepID=A0A1J7CAA2_9ACTN|nr:AMP-binding protein [Mangrovactinospora gilvigrisea]OIV36578.1 2-aminobenzoate-CoA ligase [Mangrovactinospora gilvigrisea]
MILSTSAHVDTFCRDSLPLQEQWPTFTFPLPELRYPARLNCAAELLDGAIARYGPSRVCLRAPGRRPWTYGELRRRTDRIAHVLVDELHLVPGNRVLLRGPNSPWTVACWLAVLRAGCVAVTTMPLLREPELTELIDRTAPSVALCDARLAAPMIRAAEGSGTRVVTFGADDPGDLTSRCARRARYDLPFHPVQTAADDVALLAPTSGTTGRPKITMHFHRDVLANADTFARHVLRPRGDDLFIGSPPIGFTFGLGGLVVFPMRVGASVLLLERGSPDELADAIAESGATVLFTAPTGYRAMLAEGRSERLATLRRAVSAGEPLPAAVWHAFHEATGVRIIDGIGATEMLHIFVSAGDGDIRPGTTGRAVPGYTAAVLDEEGRRAPDGTPGRLAVIGPTGCRYLRDPRQREYVRGGWNVTGDTYVRDRDGYFHYRARSDDMIISAGYNIAGPEVEQVLLGHPDVLDCGVVGAPDPLRGRVVAAYVVARAERLGDAASADLLRKELQEFVKQSIAPYKYPRRLEFVPALPRSSTGKLQRYRLREQAEEADR